MKLYWKIILAVPVVGMCLLFIGKRLHVCDILVDVASEPIREATKFLEGRGDSCPHCADVFTNFHFPGEAIRALHLFPCQSTSPVH